MENLAIAWPLRAGGRHRVTREGFKGVAATLGGPELILGGGRTGGRKIHVWWGILQRKVKVTEWRGEGSTFRRVASAFLEK